MPKITVTADSVPSKPGDAPVLLSESVRSVHLSTEHAAAQLIERLAWAVSDAEDAEGADGWDFSLTTKRSAEARVQQQAAPRRSGVTPRVRMTAKAA